MTEFEELTSEEKRKMELYRARHRGYDGFLDSGIGILDEKDRPRAMEDNVRAETPPGVNPDVSSQHFQQELERASNNFLSKLGILMWICNK